MERAQTIARLKELEPALRAMGAERLYLFGSVARGRNGVDSDVDVFIDLVPGRPFTLFDLAAAQRLLSAELAAQADLTTRDGLHPSLEADILADAIQVF